MNNPITEKSIVNVSFLNEVKQLVVQSRQQAYAAINQAMITAYWKIGQRIVQEEQKGQQRAGYGQQLLKQLSVALTEEFGKGFSVGTLYYMRQFYLVFPQIFPTGCGISPSYDYVPHANTYLPGMRAHV